MARFKRSYQATVACLLIGMLSCAALWAQSAATTGQISDLTSMTMSNYEAFPPGSVATAAPKVAPLIMLVMSRDEQLFNKAYPDYTDLDNDGTVDTTYKNNFDYNGYFDPNLCYTYAGGTFSATGSATAHACSASLGPWSGNFLNWVAMSRLDIIRWVLYGGTRSTDTAASTVLERAEIPDDLHAWAKVYTGSDIGNYTPFTSAATFCNVSNGKTGAFTTPTTTTSGITPAPVIRVAGGQWPDWATTAKLQCQWNGAGEGDSNRPKSGGANKDYTARVTVCKQDGSPTEAFCVTTGTSLKPEGLLQKYSKNDNTTAKRFGLITNGWKTPRKGGQLRRNIGKLAYNDTTVAGCATGDEFSNADGTFCYKQGTNTNEGIVITLDRLQIVGWTGADYGTTGTTGCYSPTNTAWGARSYFIQTTATMCPDFGNPLASMYADALRYIIGDTGPSQTGDTTLPTPAWVDPYGTDSGATKPRNQPCATCSIVVISSGLNSFDSENVSSVENMNSAATLTNKVQTLEGISGNYLLSTYYNTSTLTGAPTNGTLTSVGNFSDISICTPATIGNMSTLVGVCLGTPGQGGSYFIAGLSYGAWTTLIRTDGKVDSSFRVKTYGISLSDNLPSFTIPVGSKNISVSPTCRADPAGVGTYSSCYIGSVSLGSRQNLNGNTTYGLVPTTSYPNVGSFYFVWEDSQYGSDHDQDATNVISYCVGSSCLMPSTVKAGGVAICDPIVIAGAISGGTGAGTSGSACNTNGTLKNTPTATTLIMRNQWLGYSSGGMFIGYQLAGTTADGVTEFNNSGVTFGCNNLADSVCNSNPQVTTFTASSAASVSALQTPLWYAAKYSGFNGTAPVLAAGADPANYFFARNAGKLKDQLDAVFQAIAASSGNDTGNAGLADSSNDFVGNGLAYQVKYYSLFDGVAWTGSLRSFWTDAQGFLREGGFKDSAGNQVLSSSAAYIASGRPSSAAAGSATLATFRCTAPPGNDPATDPNCTQSNTVTPVWDAADLLNPYYDPTKAADATALTNIPIQRNYGDAADSAANRGQRYIFTTVGVQPQNLLSILTGKVMQNGSATGAITTGVQVPFVWTDATGDCITSDNSVTRSNNTTYTAVTGTGLCGTTAKTLLGLNYRIGNFGLLNEISSTRAAAMVNWVRGLEDTDDFRSRSSGGGAVPLQNVTASARTYRLGDIVNSSPIEVSVPAESFDLLYNDNSYLAFRTNYLHRRQMVYVGANDGMLHAFNAGFYTAAQPAAGTTAATLPTLTRTLPSGTTGSPVSTSGNNWALGQEAWAYVPSNLLAHLRWVADKSYSHVFYVDGSPTVSDVKIFGNATATGCSSGTPNVDAQGHVCGWGTIMVVPFRTGGGPISVNTLGCSGTAAASCPSTVQTSNSSYVIMDITDPEQPPIVLGEIPSIAFSADGKSSVPTFTTPSPAIAIEKDSSGNLKFFLGFGTGPVDNGGPGKLVQGSPTIPLNAYIYDLSSLVGNGTTEATFAKQFSNGPASSFAGDMVSSDYDLDNSAEGMYFGVVTNPSAVGGAFGGGLWKIDLRTSAGVESPLPSAWKGLLQIYNGGTPVTVRPTLARDPSGRDFIYFGSGRAFTDADDAATTSQGTQQQYIYGISDNSLLLGLNAACQTLAVSDASLFVSTNVQVLTDGTLGATTAGATTLASLTSALQAKSTTTPFCFTYSGWKLALTPGDGTASALVPSERVVNSQTLLGGILLTPTYVPPTKADKDASNSSDCNPSSVSGTSYLYALNYITGTADSHAASFGSAAGSGGKAGEVYKKTTIGKGKASAPSLHTTPGSGATKVTACMQIGDKVVCKDVGTISPVNSHQISWREPVDQQ
ncbi:pilus assembly protein [Pinirhizobacter soli]|uniref:pilus assembly protein n=1 Tax=Pinirhizobacter soli TaxID=2786953 RepID=UPI00202A3525|nr:hypothetical protein [Pinirhizobacter soli]